MRSGHMFVRRHPVLEFWDCIGVVEHDTRIYTLQGQGKAEKSMRIDIQRLSAGMKFHCHEYSRIDSSSECSNA